MCLGIPARVVATGVGHPDVAEVDMAGARKAVNIALLDAPPAVGDWLLIHMGFAMETMTAEQAADAMTALTDERDALRALADERDPGAADLLRAPSQPGEAPGRTLRSGDASGRA